MRALVLTCSPRNSSRGRGFTIIELLVVIAITGALLAMLFPAINSARETSRKVGCQNNLRQMALATQMYAEGNGDSLPPLWLSARRRPWQNFSWRVKLLPYLEHQNVYNRFDLAQEPLSPTNLETSRMAIEVFQCPSTPGSPRRIQSLGFAESRYDNCQVSASDYAAVFEVHDPARNFPAGGAWSGVPDIDGEIATDYVSPDAENPERRRKPAPLSHIRDGHSSTVLIVEQSGKPTALGSIPVGTPGGPESAEGAWATAEYSTFYAEGLNTDNHRDPFAFHAVVHVAYCDASVHSWPLDMSPDVIRALMTAAGKEVIHPSDWK
jgi:prepilin-type N-terminal cleavage/methylation domain-containing protein